MTLNRTNIVLACFLVVVVTITAGTRVDYTKPNIEVLPDMKYTPAWTAYEESPVSVFANRRTLQSPVTGTIARGQLPLHFEATKEDAIRAGEELQNPYQQPDTEPTLLQESVRRGGTTFGVFCVSCHGPTGAGDGPVAQRGFPPPPSLLTGNSLQMKDGQLFHILTYGQGSMSDFAGQLSPQQRWDAINYVRSMQPKPGTSEDENRVSDKATEDSANQPASTNSSELQTATGSN